MVQRHPADMLRTARMAQGSGDISRFSRRLPWLTMTPFGAEVEPEVYWRKARLLDPDGHFRLLDCAPLQFLLDVDPSDLSLCGGPLAVRPAKSAA